MGKSYNGKARASGSQDDREARQLQNRLFNALGVGDSTGQDTVTGLLRQIYDGGVGDLRFNINRNKVRQAIRDRMDRMPSAIQNHVDARESVVDKLYKMFSSLQAQWKKEGVAKSPQQDPAKTDTTQQSAGELFNFSRPSVVPDADVQVITYDNPNMPLLIRLSDLLPDPNDPNKRSMNGDWINAAAMRLDGLRGHLIQEGIMADNAVLWWSPHALNTLDATQLATPQAGESRLSSINLSSTVIRSISQHYPWYRQITLESDDGSSASALVRPNFTIIIRPPNVDGGTLTVSQADLARPTDRRGRMNLTSTTLKVPAAPVPLAVPLFTGPITPKQPSVSVRQSGDGSNFTVPQAAINALNPPGPLSGEFEYQGWGIVPITRASQGTEQPTSQLTTQSTPQATKTNPAKLPAGSLFGPELNMSGLSPNLPLALGGTQDLRQALVATPLPSVVRSPPRPLGVAESVRRNREIAARTRKSARQKMPTRLKVIPRASPGQMLLTQARQQPALVGPLPGSVQDLTKQVMRDIGTDKFEQVGAPWLGIPERQISPEIQQEKARRRITADITRGTEQLTLPDEPQVPPLALIPLPTSAPAPLAPTVPTDPLRAPRTAEDMVVAGRKRQRRFSEYQRRTNDSSSSEDQGSARKKRRLSLNSPPDCPTLPPARKATRGVKRPMTPAERQLVGDMRVIEGDMGRLTTQGPKGTSRRRSASSCVTS